jgi:ADP-dependent phosphofructokinase/glucokinase
MENRFKNTDIAEIFENYPDELRDKLLFLRTLIFEVA